MSVAKKFDTGKPQLSLLHKDFYSIVASRSANGWAAAVASLLVKAGHQEEFDSFLSCIREAIWLVTDQIGVWDTLAHTASAMEYGISKYGRNNWKQGMEWSRLLDAAIRHFTKASLGVETDEESGLLHTAHGLASLHMLWGCMACKVGTNDLFDPES